MKKIILLLLLLLTAGMATSAEKEKPKKIAAIILPEPGDGQWDKTVKLALKKIGDRILAAKADAYDYKSIQKAADEVIRKGAEKIVFVPFYISSLADGLNQARYILGINEMPSKMVQDSLKKAALDRYIAEGREGAQINIPIVFAAALDADVGIQKAITAVLKREKDSYPNTAFILAGLADYKNADITAKSTYFKLLAQTIAKETGMKAIDYEILVYGGHISDREAAQEKLLEKARAMSNKNRVVVMGYGFDSSQLAKSVKEALEKSLYTWKGVAVPSAEKLEKFALERVKEASAISDERPFAPASPLKKKKSWIL
ncbi:MAG: hypothetical protein NTW04_00525 [Elusimicrobia bacterium]|nr:hypothetical protein [Elusimicrobiota bacterium]